jgi:hypothetical protein
VTAANRLRGEMLLALPSGPVRLRPSFGALVAAEAELGSLFALLARAGAGDIRLAEMAALLWHCAIEPGCTREDFGEALLAAGTATVLPAFRAMLAAAFEPG